MYIFGAYPRCVAFYKEKIKVLLRKHVRGKEMKKVLIAICLGLLLTAPLLTTVGAVTYVPVAGGKGYIEKKSGYTDLFGGGEYVSIRFMRQVPGKTYDVEDAQFAVIWGNDTNPNSIILYSEVTRYLGAARVYDIHGGLVSGRAPIVVKTIWVQKLEDIFEYYDANGDEVCNTNRDGILYSDHWWHEPVYKKVSLNTSWTRSPVNETLDPDGKHGSWTFSLTAENLTYTDIGITTPSGDNLLNKLTFTFHLEAQLVNVTASVPCFNITVDAANGYTIVDSEKVEVKEFNGTRVDYGVKYDHEIVGWDFDPKNPAPRLLLEWHAIVGNYIPEKTAEWLKEELLSRIGNGTGTMVAETTNGTEVFNEERANSTRPRLIRVLKPARLHLLDDWEKIGSLTWVTSVNVTENEGEEPTVMNMTAQIQGHQRITVPLPHGVYKGFALLAGYSYPAGYRIYHDPEMTASTNILNISEITSEPASTPLLQYAIAAVIGAAVAIGIIAVLKRRK